MAGSQCLQAHLKSTRQAACSPSANWPVAPESAASAVRYYEELGLLPAPARISGQRRYPESAVRIVAAILLYSDAGFTLAEQKALMARAHGAPG